MKKILILTNSSRIEPAIAGAVASAGIAKDCEVQCIYAKNSSAWSGQWEKKLAGASYVLAKWMGGRILPFWGDVKAYLKDSGIPYGLVPNQEDQEEAPEGISPDVMNEVRRYMFCSGEENYRNLVLYLASTLGGVKTEYGKPHELVWAGIYHPGMDGRAMASLAEYEKSYCKEGRPSVGILFYRDEWLWGDLAYKDALIREIERQGMNAVCVFTNGRPDPSLGMPGLMDVIQQFFMKDGKPFVDVILNTMKFSITVFGHLTTKDLQKISIPIFEAYTLMTEYEDWKDSEEGMNSMAVSISVALPEFDGGIHGVPIASKHVGDDGKTVYIPIEDRIRRMVRRAKKWAVLRHKDNHDKKIAIIFHNYPAKNSNIGSAAGLDSIESVILLLKRMKADGYNVASIPESREAFLKELTSHATNDRAFLTDAQAETAQRISRADYMKFWDTLSKEAKDAMTQKWGEAPGDYLLGDDGALLLPGYFDGNVFLTVQPSRAGAGEDAEAVYHDLHIPPTHQYLGFYEWLQHVWGADAVIHMGTHGTQEWLPGKGVAQDRDSYGDITIGDMPNLYPYFMTIAGEGLQAKRRGAAALIGYLPAPMTNSGAYDELAELDKLMDEYAKARKNSPDALQSLQKMITDKAKEANLDEGLPSIEKDGFDKYFQELHNTLEDIEDSSVHMGLHVFGQPPEGEELTQYILQMLRMQHGDVPSIVDLFASRAGYDSDQLLKHPGDVDEKLDLTYSEILKKAKEDSERFVKILQNRGFTEAAEKTALSDESLQGGSEDFQKRAARLAQFICRELVPKLMETREEEDHLMDGLSGRYIEPGPSGSPQSVGISLLPSGRNFYGADPRGLPSPAAWELGKKLGDSLIERFIQEEGHYPENIGLVLWSGPNMRSSGQDIAEILYLLGIRPVWQPGTLHVQDLKVIPLSELKRPRLDVTCRISGLFRDTLSPVIDLIDKAVLLAGGLDESDDDNFLRKHIREDSREIEAAGNSADDAWRMAAYRIFGNARGAYGAGVANLLETKQWQNEDDIAKVYIRWGAHAYGGGKKGLFMPDQFKKRLASMEMTVKNDDTHDINLLSSDDYNAFHGGMIAAIKSVRGKAPRSYEGDSNNKDHPVMRSVAEEMKRVFRSEAMNPKYIEGMKKYGYKGASDMANLLAHSFQWDATSGVMEDWMYEGYAEKYALDPEMQKWMKKANPWAQQRIAETLLEANQRGMWHAKPEMAEELRKLYLSVEGELEEDSDDDDDND